MLDGESPGRDQERRVEETDRDERRAERLQQDQGDEQIEAGARAQLGQLDARHLPGRRRAGRACAVVMPSEARETGWGLIDGDFLGSLQGGQASRAARGRAAERRGEMKPASASRPRNPRATRTTRLIKKPRSGGIGLVVVEAHPSVDLEPGLVQPAKPGRVDPHHEIIEPGIEPVWRPFPRERSRRRARSPPATRTPGWAGGSIHRPRTTLPPGRRSSVPKRASAGMR